MEHNRGITGFGLPTENPGSLPFPKEQLYPLLQRQLILYTGTGSSSVPVETAGEILAGMLYCIQLGSTGGTPEECFTLGQAEIKRQVMLGRSLLKSVQASVLPIENLAYQDTLAALPAFFTWYDYRYLAHDVPCDIDYPLSIFLPDEPGGILYINAYLRTLGAENEFCSCFSIQEIQAVLCRYALDWKNQLYNIFDAVFTNAIGHTLASQKPGSLLLHPAALPEMHHRLAEGPFTLEQQLQKACDALTTELLPENSTIHKHLLCKGTAQLLPRLQQALSHNRLSSLFIPITAP